MSGRRILVARSIGQDRWLVLDLGEEYVVCVTYGRIEADVIADLLEKEYRE